jgi:carboxyl-terminal processing protease
MRWMRTGFIGLVIFTMGYMAGTGNILSVAQDDDLHQVIFAPLFQAYELIGWNYHEEVDDEVLVNGALRGMLDAVGDPYTNYVDPEYWEFVSSDLDDTIEGIGVVISGGEDGTPRQVVNVLQDTPAERSGVQVGDIFHEVNGEDVTSLNNLELAARVRGPAGTSVTIVFQRGDEFVTFEVERAQFDVPNVEYDLIEEHDIAYISMSQFSNLSHAQLLEAIDQLNVNKRQGLILDLRGNSGGYLTAAIDIAGLFIKEGRILREEFSNGRYLDFEISDGRAYQVEMNGNRVLYSTKSRYADVQVPIVLLVDERSASASELVAGAWQDHGVLTLIGETTFGKGTVQTQQNLINGGGLRITVAKWLTPNLEWITGQGITPDIIVSVPEGHDLKVDGDIQLDAAIEFLTGNVEN